MYRNGTRTCHNAPHIYQRKTRSQFSTTPKGQHLSLNWVKILYLTVFYLSAGEKLPQNNCSEGLAVDTLKKSGLLNKRGPPQVCFTGKKRKKKKGY